MQANDLSVVPVERSTARALKPGFSLLEVGFLIVILAGAFGAIAWYTVSTFRRQLADAAFQSPLPDVRVAKEEAIPDSKAYKKPYDFSTDWFTYDIPVWEVVLAPYKAKPGIHYLEVGLYEGRSALWALENILTHPTARLTGVDPFLGPYKEKYFANIERSGASDKVTTITGYSQVVLRGLPLESFDIIYIDGSHSKEDVLEDAVLSWRLLKEGGTLIFDDYRWAGSLVGGTAVTPTELPKIAIDPFIQCFEKHLDVMHNSHQLIVRKRFASGKETGRSLK